MRDRALLRCRLIKRRINTLRESDFNGAYKINMPYLKMKRNAHTSIKFCPFP